MAGAGRINNREREMWVQNDEVLYTLWQESGLSMWAFLRNKEYRLEVDLRIKEVTRG